MEAEFDNTEKGKAGEAFVNELAFNSFLKYWCYPGPLDIIKDYKEICDLLIVFKTVCVIVSVKNYSFKGNYERYFRSTTERAIRQILGAEKTLFRDDPVVLKHPDREAETFDKKSIQHIYRIIVNLNSQVRLYQTSLFEKEKDFMVMDANAWASAIKELDTLPDFLNYLNERLKLTNKGPAFILPRDEYDFSTDDANYLLAAMSDLKNESVTMISGTELDLIAIYYKNGFRFPPVPRDKKYDKLMMKIDGEWGRYLASDAFKTKTDAGKDGYFVDEIVKQMIIDHVDGHRIAKILFSLNRYQRAIFSKHFLEFYSQRKSEGHDQRPHYYARANPKMVFLYFKDDYPHKTLQRWINVYLIHMNYLLNYSLEEIALIGKSHSGTKFAFGYIRNNHIPTAAETAELEKHFKELNLKLRSDVSALDLSDVPFPKSPLFKSPF